MKEISCGLLIFIKSKTQILVAEIELKFHNPCI
jgi:hypothetical protein